jgi:hypothetical protein
MISRLQCYLAIWTSSDGGFGSWIAVEMPITGHPPHGSGRARFEHPAPTWVFDGEALIGPGMKADGTRPDAAQITSALARTARDLGAPGKDPVFGWGLLQAASPGTTLTQ